VPLMVLLVGPMGVEGLALALSISAVLEVAGLLWSLRGRLEGIQGRSIAGSLFRAGLAALVAALVMAAGLWALDTAVSNLLADPVGRLVGLLLLTAAGAVAFVLVARALGSPELTQLFDAVRRRRRSA
jgi:peptidoglycan biosynthesis protein MviN/MurJ (putative lipid II flippase)